MQPLFADCRELIPTVDDTDCMAAIGQACGEKTTDCACADYADSRSFGYCFH